MYYVSSEIKEKLINDMVALFKEYHHYATYEGCEMMVNEWLKNKSKLMETLSKHPKWNAENLRIEFTEDYERGFDSEAISSFKTWVVDKYDDVVLKPKAIKIEGRTYSELVAEYENTVEAYRKVEWLYERSYVTGLSYTDKVGDMNYFDWKMKLHEIKNLYNYANRRSGKDFECMMGEFYPCEVARAKLRLIDFLRYLANQCHTPKIDESVVEYAKEWYPDIRIGAGSTVMKLIRRVLSLPEFKELNEWSETTTREWIDENTGECHTREKVISLESQLAVLGDKISPLRITRHTLVSVNPLDYLTMSFGHKWASCQTIDCENVRGTQNHYHGEYCTGTISYMCDASTVVFYTVDSTYDGTAYETQDKMQRCLFYISENGDVVVQSRVYPDGRDGGDASLASQYRAVMQQVISDAFEKPNYWLVRKGTSYCEEYIYTDRDATHYRDYECYSDCNVSLRQNVSLDGIKIYVGHAPIDPENGEEHSETGCINGSSECGDYIEHCAHCNARINTERDDYEYINGEHFCCADCAEAEGYVYCENRDDWFDRDSCYQDAWSEYWYYGDPEVTTEDGYEFYSEDNARSYGYEHDADWNWYPEEDLFFDNWEQENYHRNELEVEIDVYHMYRSEENAINDGCICINDEWFASENDAENAGYHYIEEVDRWLSEDECTEYRKQMAEEQINEAENGEEVA